MFSRARGDRSRRRDDCISLPLVVVVRPPSPSRFSVEERRDVTSVLYFAYRRRNADSSFNPTAFQECECHGFLRPRGITFALEIDFVVPVNRYTVYALRPSRLSFPLCPSARVVSCRLTMPSYFPPLRRGFRWKRLYAVAESRRCTLMQTFRVSRNRVNMLHMYAQHRLHRFFLFYFALFIFALSVLYFFIPR